ncbi:MAG: glycosyltransferase [Flavobacterium sp.]
MTIFQFIQRPQKRGAEVFASQLSEELQSLGHKVVLICLFEGVAELPFSGEIIYLNRPVSKRWYDFYAWKKIAQLIKKRKPDLIQCNAGDTLKFVILSKLFFCWNVPVITRNASTVSSYIQSKVTKSLNGFLYKQVNRVISVSQFSARDLNALFSVTKGKTIVIPIGIQQMEINPIPFETGTGDTIHFVHVGGFTFEKNHAGLLKIWKKIADSHPNAKLHLLGDGPLRENTRDEVINLKLENSVVFHGWVKNPMDYMVNAKALLLPSIIEGLPGVILEAMYCKTPVIAYDTGGISEVVHNGKTGYLIPKNDEDNFVKAMENVIVVRQETIIENAFQLVKNNFTNKGIARQFESAYLEMVKVSK